MTPPHNDGISSRDKALIKVGSLLGAGALSVGEAERFRTLKAAAEAGPVKEGSKKSLKDQFAEQFVGMTERQLRAAEEALYDVQARAVLGEAILDGEDVDHDDEWAA